MLFSIAFPLLYELYQNRTNFESSYWVVEVANQEYLQYELESDFKLCMDALVKTGSRLNLQVNYIIENTK